MNNKAIEKKRSLKLTERVEHLYFTFLNTSSSSEVAPSDFAGFHSCYIIKQIDI